MRDEKIIRNVAERVKQFINDQAEGKNTSESWRVMCRKIRLELGRGPATAAKILAEDYNMHINEYGEAENNE